MLKVQKEAAATKEAVVTKEAAVAIEETTTIADEAQRVGIQAGFKVFCQLLL